MDDKKRAIIMEWHTLREARAVNTWMEAGQFRQASMNSVNRAVSDGYMRQDNNMTDPQLCMYIITHEGLTRLSQLESDPYVLIAKCWDDLHIAWIRLLELNGGLDSDVSSVAKALTELKSVINDEQP